MISEAQRQAAKDVHSAVADLNAAVKQATDLGLKVYVVSSQDRDTTVLVHYRVDL